MEDTIIFVTEVRAGDVIRSSQFENLLFKDLSDQDAFCGFWVNPRKTRRRNDNVIVTMLESPGLMQRRMAKIKQDKININLSYHIDPKREFVVIYTFRDTSCVKEYNNEDDRFGHFPLRVIAKMLSPDGDYDPNGVEIDFRMQCDHPMYIVNEVESVGFMRITFERIL